MSIPTFDEVTVAAVRQRIAELMPRLRANLEALARIPSISAADDRTDLDRSAQAVAQLLRDAGMPQVRITSVAGGAPAVIGHRPGAPGARHVLLYAHHDVQPPGDRQAWDSEPFEPAQRGERLYGRGVADDKAGIMVHVAALLATAENCEAAVTVFVEGEEEIGSPTFAQFLREHREELAADVIVVADSSNWQVGQPALTTSLRGLIGGTIEVRTLAHPVHSGVFGGAVPDATMAMVALLATCWDADGRVCIPGLDSAPDPVLEYPPAQLRVDSGILADTSLIGAGPVASRLWAQPAFTITGMDIPSVAQASNTLAATVRAKFSLRVAPHQDLAAAQAAIRAHLEAGAPWGAKVTVNVTESAPGWAAHESDPVTPLARQALAAAWDHEPVDMGVGGTIGFIEQLQSEFPDATVLVTGVEDPDSRAHGPNESLHLPDFEKACVAEALVLQGITTQS